MAKILKGELDPKQNSRASWLVETIKNLILRSFKDLRIPVFSLKSTQEAALHNSNILANLYGNLGKAIKSQKVIPLDYGSQFRDFSGIAKIFIRHEDKKRIVDIIQKGCQYHLLSIEEAIRKPDLEVILLRVNCKSEK